jgi:hypothetical protein
MRSRFISLRARCCKPASNLVPIGRDTPVMSLPRLPFYGTLLVMGSKDKGRKEVKKAPKPKPKVEPGRKRETFAPAPTK